jgi:hypothetical protein
VKGRPVLLRRLRGLLLAAHRFGRARATSLDDRRWSARLVFEPAKGEEHA